MSLLALAGIFAIYWFQFKNSDTPSAPKQEAIIIKNHSAVFDNSIDSLLQAYFDIKEAFVEGDSIKAKAANNVFIAQLNNFNADELKKDSNAIFESATAF